MPDGRLWLLRDSYAAQTAWAPRHVGRELRLSRLGAFDAALGAVRADAEAQAARKAGDHNRAARHEHLAASYRAMRDHYQQQQQALAQARADRQEWEHATARSRDLAIAAEAELCRRYPDQKMEPLRSAEPALVSDTEREQLQPVLDGVPDDSADRIRDPAAERQVFQAKLGERQRVVVPSKDLDWGGLGEALASWGASRRDAILQPPKPQITPSAIILQLTSQHDIELEAADLAFLKASHHDRN